MGYMSGRDEDMKSLKPALVCTIVLLSLKMPANLAGPAQEDLRAGKNFIPTPVYTAEEDREILRLFEGLRVSDVSDGMDKAGLPGLGLVDPAILPLWTDTEKFTHRIVGIAVTARYVPTQRPPAGKMEPQEFDKWESEFYGLYSPEPFLELIRPGTVLVLDDVEEGDVGTVGSSNIAAWKLRGCVGVVTDASARDTDEIALQRIPLYLRHRGRGIRPGRNEIESVNRPVAVGGVLVKPGDVVVADGDGVIVVPRASARDVATFAREVMEKDRAGRRDLYQELGRPPDLSVSNIAYAGVRSSQYGIKPFPAAGGWQNAIAAMGHYFPGSTPAAIWIVGEMKKPRTCRLTFPSDGRNYPNIQFEAADKHEPYLAAFDRAGVKVFLQVEPAQADVGTLIDLVLNRYKHHDCVAGFGVDVEWHREAEDPGRGVPVDDETARLWEERVKSHNASYRLFLKHWDQAWMPKTYRGEIVFVDDSQIFDNFESMVEEFASSWAPYFYPNTVFFQIGYKSDKPWWQKLGNPPETIGKAIAARVKQTCGIFWVDFTLRDVLPAALK